LKLHCLYDDKERLATQLVRCLLACTTEALRASLNVCWVFVFCFPRICRVARSREYSRYSLAAEQLASSPLCGSGPGRAPVRQAQSARKPGEKSFRTTRKAGRPKPAGSLPMILGIDNSPRQLRAAEQLRLPSIVQRDGAQIKKSRPGLPLPCSACKIVQNLRTAPSISIAGLQMGG
jgi:hypothetical protein